MPENHHALDTGGAQRLQWGPTVPGAVPGCTIWGIPDNAARPN